MALYSLLTPEKIKDINLSKEYSTLFKKIIIKIKI